MKKRKKYQRRAWNIAAKFDSAAMCITMTPNETEKATVISFSDDINKQNLDQVSLNDIPPNAFRIEIAGKDPVACYRVFSNILEILIKHRIGSDI